MWLGNLIVQLLGLAGFLLLAFPAFHVAKYGRLMVSAEAARPGPGGAGEKPYQTALKALQNHRDSWKPWKGWCLKWGTGLTILSYALAAYLAYNAPDVPAHASADGPRTLVNLATPRRS